MDKRWSSEEDEEEEEEEEDVGGWKELNES